jgi:hypothetical protein
VPNWPPPNVPPIDVPALQALALWAAVLIAPQRAHARLTRHAAFATCDRR